MNKKLLLGVTFSLSVFLCACGNNTQNNVAVTDKNGNKHYCDGELEVINDAGDTKCDADDGSTTYMSGGVFFANFSSYDSAQKSKASGKSGTYTAPKTSSTDKSTDSSANKVETNKSDSKVKSNKSSSSSGKSSGFSSGRSGGGSS